MTSPLQIANKDALRALKYIATRDTFIFLILYIYEHAYCVVQLAF
jgi:hypothetical protein